MVIEILKDLMRNVLSKLSLFERRNQIYTRLGRISIGKWKDQIGQDSRGEMSVKSFGWLDAIEKPLSNQTSFPWRGFCNQQANTEEGWRRVER